MIGPGTATPSASAKCPSWQDVRDDGKGRGAAEQEPGGRLERHEDRAEHRGQQEHRQPNDDEHERR